MNPEVQFVLSITSSVVYAGYSGYQFCKKRNTSSLYGVLTSSVEGMREVLDEIEIDTDRIYPVLVDDAWCQDHSTPEQYQALQRHQGSDSLLYSMLQYHLVKEYLKEMKKLNPKLVFVVITDSHKLLQDLKIKHKSLLLPSSKYHVKLQQRIEEQEVKEQDQLNREKYLGLNYPTFTYSHKTSLVDIYEKIFLKKSDYKNIAL